MFNRMYKCEQMREAYSKSNSMMMVANVLFRKIPILKFLSFPSHIMKFQEKPKCQNYTAT